MEFMASRTSKHNDQKPCNEAYQKRYTRVDERIVDHPGKIPGNGHLTREEAQAKWLAEGTNHRVEDGHIKRFFRESGWFVKISGLKGLLAFYEKYGNLTLTPCMWNHKIIELEIYDDYRE